MGAAASLPPPVSCFEIRTTDAGSRARTGTLRLAHGEVRTPAFVPLATKAVVKTLEVREAAELGFDMVLGNTFHLFLTPGHELIRDFGGIHGFMRWDRPVITDSGRRVSYRSTRPSGLPVRLPTRSTTPTATGWFTATSSPRTSC